MMGTVLEQWAPVLDPRFKQSYEVSDMGRARSVPRQVAGKNGSIRTVQGRVLSPGVRRDGTRAVNLWMEGAGIQFPVARLILEAFSGRRQPSGYAAKPIDGNPANLKLSNLRWEPVGGLGLLKARLTR
jgi:hypothetical protein